jgi:CoA-transferase family III
MSPAELWAASGCLALTGWPDSAPSQLGRPAAAFAAELAQRITTETAGAGDQWPTRTVDLDGPALLAERSAHTFFQRQGNRSCNGTSRVLRCADGHISLTLSRPSDIDLLSAVFEQTYSTSIDPWQFAAKHSVKATTRALADQAVLLGLSVAEFGVAEVSSERRVPREQVTRIGGEVSPQGSPLVVDLSALWAGPLAANICGMAGAHVIKVESSNRPDGTRFASPAFFDLLHGGHDSVVIDFTSATGRRQLVDLIKRSDAVITSARPRAFEQLGIDPDELMRNFPITCWMAITAFGPSQPGRIGFGDDAAVAGGLFGRTGRGPIYVADAIADPLTGLFAASILLRALRTGERVIANVALAEVAAMATAVPAGDPLAEPVPCAPRSRPVATVAATPGADNVRWLS